jgi:hypothetical protein
VNGTAADLDGAFCSFLDEAYLAWLRERLRPYPTHEAGRQVERLSEPKPETPTYSTRTVTSFCGTAYFDLPHP